MERLEATMARLDTPNASAWPEARDRLKQDWFDAYIGRFARAAAEWGHGFLLDFGHEMNIDQAAWSGWCNGGADGGPEQFVRTYRYLHDRFVGELEVPRRLRRRFLTVWSPR